MCLVTYIPQGPDSFVLSSNRDENPFRSPHNLTRLENQDSVMVFPRDTEAGGSWIIAENHDRIVCLLNGAFEKHVHQPPYKRSRGIMALEYFRYAGAGTFAAEYEFEGMEPFTMVIAEKGELFELRWDEKRAHFLRLDAQGYHVWSSATLYPPPVREKRKGWFLDWLSSRNDRSLEAINALHRTGGEGDPVNDYIMNRGIVRTVSITHVVKKGGSIGFIYHDLLRETTKTESILLRGTPRKA